MSYFGSAKKRKHSSSDEETSEYGSPKKNSTFYEEEEDTDEVADTDILPPNIMLPMVQDFADYVKSHSKEGYQAKSMQKLASEFVKNCEEDIDTDKFVKSYKKYLNLANKAMSVKTSTESILEFLDRGETVKMFQGFPKPPPSLLHYYCKKHNVTIGFGQMGTAKMKLTNDTERRRQCELELHKLEEKFVSELATFLDEKDDQLTENQKKYVQQKLSHMKKKIYGAAPRTPGKTTKKKEPQTAFDYFLKTMSDKYTDLEPQAREKKLRKKFNKLDDDTREIFEKIAMK